MQLKPSINLLLSDMIKRPQKNEKKMIENIESCTEEEEKDSVLEDPDYFPESKSRAKKGK